MNIAIQEAYELNFSNLTILECGANREGNETIGFREKNDCYYIEAIEEDLNILRQQQSTIKKENTFHYALTNYDGNTTFNICSHLGNSSINYSQDHLDELSKRGASFKQVVVPCITYKNFIRNIIKKPIDILVLDIEGGEIDVLESMKELNKEELPKIFAIEAGYDWEKRKVLLKELGYEIDFYYENNVVLSHPFFNLGKRKNNINSINMRYPRFIWCDKLIFENDCEIL